MYGTLYSYQNLMNLELSRQIFEKCWNVKFHENPSSESRVFTRGRTDRHDKATFCWPCSISV